METSAYAFTDARLTALEAELKSTGDRGEAVKLLYSRLGEVIAYLPDAPRSFIEWWLMQVDFECIKDAISQIYGKLRFQIDRPTIKVDRGSLIKHAAENEISGILDLISNAFEGFERKEFDDLKTYGEYAYRLDKFYFDQMVAKIPRSDYELARRLISIRVDLLNLKLRGRAQRFDELLLPYGALAGRDLVDDKRIEGVLMENYNVRDEGGLMGYLKYICTTYYSGFSKVMQFIIQEHLMLSGGHSLY